MKKQTLYMMGLLALGQMSLLAGCGQAEPVSKPPAAATPQAGAPVITLPPIVEQLRVDVQKDCGAKGDGKTNDNAAFQKAAKLIQEKGGGTLVTPKATYIVGEQKHEAGKFPYYQAQTIFEVVHLNGLLIEGNDATLRIAPNMRFGSFDKETGARYDPPQAFRGSRLPRGHRLYDRRFGQPQRGDSQPGTRRQSGQRRAGRHLGRRGTAGRRLRAVSRRQHRRACRQSPLASSRFGRHPDRRAGFEGIRSADAAHYYRQHF